MKINDFEDLANPSLVCDTVDSSAETLIDA